MKGNELKEIDIKNSMCCYLDDAIENGNFDLGDILINEKSYKKFMIFHTKFCLVQDQCLIDLIKWMDLFMELDI